MRLMSRLVSVKFAVQILREHYWIQNNRRDQNSSVIEVNLPKRFVFFSLVKYASMLSPSLFILASMVFQKFKSNHSTTPLPAILDPIPAEGEGQRSPLYRSVPVHSGILNIF